MDCFGRGSNVMAPSGPVLLPPPTPIGRPVVGEDATSFPAVADDSLAESSAVDSVSEGVPGESYPCIGLGGMGDGSPQR